MEVLLQQYPYPSNNSDQTYYDFIGRIIEINSESIQKSDVKLLPKLDIYKLEVKLYLIGDNITEEIKEAYFNKIKDWVL